MKHDILGTFRTYFLLLSLIALQEAISPQWRTQDLFRLLWMLLNSQKAKVSIVRYVSATVNKLPIPMRKKLLDVSIAVLTKSARNKQSSVNIQLDSLIGRFCSGVLLKRKTQTNKQRPQLQTHLIQVLEVFYGLGRVLKFLKGICRNFGTVWTPHKSVVDIGKFTTMVSL